jgi:hypothetical protein
MWGAVQAVHHPHEAPPAWSAQSSDIDSYRGMLWGTDIYVGQLTQLLRDKNMWDDTFIVFVSTQYQRCSGTLWVIGVLLRACISRAAGCHGSPRTTGEQLAATIIRCVGCKFWPAPPDV